MTIHHDADAPAAFAPRRPVDQKLRINVLRAALLLVVPLLVVVEPALGYGTFGHEILEAAGIITLLAGVLGRFWSILYVGARKNREVMQDGPYSMTRNPLYVFSTVAATGIGLMMGAVFFAVLLGGAVGTILYLTARREAAYLEQEFGETFRAYAARVPFFLPDPRLYRSSPEVTFTTRTLRTNLFDAFVFLSFIPLVELFDTFKLWLDWHLFRVF